MEHVRPLLLAIAFALAVTAKGEESAPVGRYQLSAGKIEILFVGGGKDKNAVYPEQTLFKIDTATGKVWALEVIAVAGQKPRYNWRLLE